MLILSILVVYILNDDNNVVTYIHVCTLYTQYDTGVIRNKPQNYTADCIQSG